MLYSKKKISHSKSKTLDYLFIINYRNLVCTSIFMITTACIAAVFPDISAVLSILGGLCSVTICYLIPSNHNLKNNL